MPYGARVIRRIHRQQRKANEVSFVFVLFADGGCRDRSHRSLSSDCDCCAQGEPDVSPIPRAGVDDRLERVDGSSCRGVAHAAR